MSSLQKQADEEDRVKMAALAEKMAAKNTRGRQGLAAQLAGSSGVCACVCGCVCGCICGCVYAGFHDPSLSDPVFFDT